MDFPFETIAHSSADTKAVARAFAEAIKGGGVVALIGPLGAGKTTFVQGLAQAIGIKERVLSPSFVLHRRHGRLHHIDLYRLEMRQSYTALGLTDILKDSKAIVVIEWAEKLASFPPDTIVCRFSILNGDERRIHIDKAG